MIRLILACGALAALGACAGDGRGSQYSSARAQTSAAPVFVPVTPGATPVVTQTGPAPLATVPATATATPVPDAGVVTTTTLAPTPGVLTEPIAVTPGAVPIDTSIEPAVLSASAQAPSASLKPVNAPGRAPAPQVIQASAPAATSTQPARRPSQSAARARYARGEIYSACRDAGRSEATDKRCGCVQWVADQQLTAAQQRRGAGYFRNQQGLQDARQSDNTANERFWDAWKAFGQSAAQQCR